MSTSTTAAHKPCGAPFPRSQMSSSSRFQQLLQAKLVAEKGVPSSPSPAAPAPALPLNQAYDHLSRADTVFNPSFAGQHYPQPGQMYTGSSAKGSAEAEDPISTAFRTVVSERIASMYADTQDQAGRQGWHVQNQESMPPPDILIKQEPTEPWQANNRSGPFPELWSTPVQQRPHRLQPEFSQWRDNNGKSPQSVNSTPSMMESCSSISSGGLPLTPLNTHTPLPNMANTHLVPYTNNPRDRADSLNSLKGSPVAAPAALQPYGMSAFTNMNGQVTVTGMIQAASNEGDGSLNLNGLTGDGGGNGGYDHGYGGDGGGYGYGGNGHDNYGPPGGEGSNGGGQGGGGGGGGGDGGPPPPPPKGKKLTLACHFCRRRKLKCDGIKPVCENCAKRGETCIFDDNVRRRGPGRRTKENMQNRNRHQMLNNTEAGSFSQFSLPLPLGDQPYGQFGMSDHVPHDPNQASTPDLGQMATAAQQQQQQQQQQHDGVPSANLPDIDPNIDPALAILGMGIDPDNTHHSELAPATLAEADPTRAQKRKSDLVGGDDDDHKRLKLEDETYEGTLPGDIGVGDVSHIPGFEGWNPASLGEGREGEVDEADLAKFENDLRRVIQDQADAEAQASGQ